MSIDQPDASASGNLEITVYHDGVYASLRITGDVLAKLTRAQLVDAVTREVVAACGRTLVVKNG